VGLTICKEESSNFPKRRITAELAHHNSREKLDQSGLLDAYKGGCKNRRSGGITQGGSVEKKDTREETSISGTGEENFFNYLGEKGCVAAVDETGG